MMDGVIVFSFFLPYVSVYERGEWELYVPVAFPSLSLGRSEFFIIIIFNAKNCPLVVAELTLEYFLFHVRRRKPRLFFYFFVPFPRASTSPFERQTSLVCCVCVCVLLRCVVKRDFKKEGGGEKKKMDRCPERMTHTDLFTFQRFICCSFIFVCCVAKSG